MKRDIDTTIAIAAAATELAGEARALHHELAEDLVRVAFVCLEELRAVHAEHTTPAAPAWWTKGGAA